MNGNVHRYRHIVWKVNYLIRIFKIVQKINAYEKKQYNLERTLIFFTVFECDNFMRMKYDSRYFSPYLTKVIVL